MWSASKSGDYIDDNGPHRARSRTRASERPRIETSDQISCADMTDVHARPVQHRSMADQVAAELRRMVLSGAFKENERLTQEKLAKMLGVSTMPIREALLRLTAEGLIVASANRSFAVASNSPDDIRDTYWAFGQITGELAYRACLAHGADLAKPLSDLHAVHKASINDPDARFRANWQFHRTINLSAGSPR